MEWRSFGCCMIEWMRRCICEPNLDQKLLTIFSEIAHLPTTLKNYQAVVKPLFQQRYQDAKPVFDVQTSQR